MNEVVTIAMGESIVAISEAEPIVAISEAKPIVTISEAKPIVAIAKGKATVAISTESVIAVRQAAATPSMTPHASSGKTTAAGATCAAAVHSVSRSAE